MDWQAVFAILGIVVSVLAAVGSACAVMWRVGKTEGTVSEKLDGVGRALDALVRGESATCAAHKAKLEHLETECGRHQDWLEDHVEVLRDHGERLTRIEAHGG